MRHTYLCASYRIDLNVLNRTRIRILCESEQQAYFCFKRTLFLGLIKLNTVLIRLTSWYERLLHASFSSGLHFTRTHGEVEPFTTNVFL